jgi:hypothetical protein
LDFTEAGTSAAIEGISDVAGVAVVLLVVLDVVGLELDPQPVIRTTAMAQATHPSRATLKRISVFLLVRIRESVPSPGRESIGEVGAARSFRGERLIRV